jgi:hypothetical protein
VQVSVHEVDAVASHIVLQVVVNAGAVHSAVHPPESTKWQLDGSWMVMVPSAVVQVVAAEAVVAQRSEPVAAKVARTIDFMSVAFEDGNDLVAMHPFHRTSTATPRASTPTASIGRAHGGDSSVNRLNTT